jgi:diguanylate cyclase (GGDEF)-like protein
MAPHDPPPTLASRVSRAFTWAIATLAATTLIVVAVLMVIHLRFEPQRTNLQEGQKALALGDRLLSDQETALHGYVLTHDGAFLSPVLRDAPAIEHANAALARTIGSDPEFAGLLLDKRVAEAALIATLTRIAQAQDGPADDATILAKGTALFDAYRAREHLLASAIDDRVAAIDAAVHATLELGAAVQLIVVIGVTLFAFRERRALHDTVLGVFDKVSAAIHRVRDGELDVTVPAGGPPELRRVTTDLAEMTLALASDRSRRESQRQMAVEHARLLHVVLEAARELSESLNLDYVLRAGASAVAVLASGPVAVSIWLVEDEAKQLVLTFDSTEPGGKPTARDPLDFGKGIAGRAVKYGRLIVDQGDEPELEISTAAAFPLIVGARVIGVIVARPTARPWPKNPDFIPAIEMLASHAAADIESARLHQLTEERSQIDALTRSLNRRRLDEDLANECRRSARYARPLSVIMLDVDNFKVINDTYGHARGDTVLQHVADALRAAVRATDSVYRYGGEEFVVLLRETRAEAAKELAERLRRRLEQYFVHDASGRITASFGVAELDASQAAPLAVLEAADRALYEAKRAGRNRVSVAPPMYPRLDT